MKEYSDLELNKMMATLEFDSKDIEYPIYGKGWPYVKYHEQGIPHRFSAITNKEHLFNLMVKYKVEIDYIECEIAIYDGWDPVSACKFTSESEIPRAIIMCILKSKNII